MVVIGLIGSPFGSSGTSREPKRGKRATGVPLRSCKGPKHMVWITVRKFFFGASRPVTAIPGPLRRPKGAQETNIFAFWLFRAPKRPPRRSSPKRKRFKKRPGYGLSPSDRRLFPVTRFGRFSSPRGPKWRFHFCGPGSAVTDCLAPKILPHSVPGWDAFISCASRPLRHS